MDATESGIMASSVSRRKVSGFLWKINRLRAMTVLEVIHRVTDMASQRLEQWAVARAWMPKPACPVKPRLSLFVAPEDWMKTWQEHFSLELESLNELLKGRIGFFGQAPLDMGESINWHRDPLTGIEAPLTFGKTLNYRDDRLVGNIKFLWELGRHQHLIPLAAAYACTGELRYRDAVIKQIESWMQQNPYGMGIHWCSALEPALRLISWAVIHSLLTLRDGEAGLFSAVSDPVKLGQAIYQQTHFVRHFLSRDSSANNHLIGELTGIWVACSVFDLGRHGDRWALFAQEALEREARLQVFDDGVNKEQASYYHLWVLDYFLFAWLVGLRRGQHFSEAFAERIVSMAGFLQAISPGCSVETTPNPSVPSLSKSKPFVLSLSKFKPFVLSLSKHERAESMNLTVLRQAQDERERESDQFALRQAQDEREREFDQFALRQAQDERAREFALRQAQGERKGEFEPSVPSLSKFKPFVLSLSKHEPNESTSFSALRQAQDERESEFDQFALRQAQDERAREFALRQAQGERKGEFEPSVPSLSKFKPFVLSLSKHEPNDSTSFSALRQAQDEREREFALRQAQDERERESDQFALRQAQDERKGESDQPALRQAQDEQLKSTALIDCLPPQIGDADDGFVTRFSVAWPQNPYRDVLAAVEAVFDNVSTPTTFSQKAFWYTLCFDNKPLPIRPRQVTQATYPRLFPKGGYAVLGNSVLHLVFDAGSLGYPSIAAHGHADALSVCLAVDGFWWLVDPGTYAYHSDHGWRDYFRGTAAHNTLVIDGRNQSEIGGPFLWLRHAQGKIIAQGEDADGTQWVTGEHDGYRKAAGIHKRRVVLQGSDAEMNLYDEIQGHGAHDVAIHFHFAPDIDVVPGVHPGTWQVTKLGSERRMTVFVDASWHWDVFRGSDSPRSGWFSPALGSKVPSCTLRGVWRGHLPTKLVTRLVVQ
ncbi:MAG: hypothetical protein HOP23_03120 [Methylococcaceae bacterium]|nr:hypothetical protein [Methylococcaceae bacterium]